MNIIWNWKREYENSTKHWSAQNEHTNAGGMSGKDAKSIFRGCVNFNLKNFTSHLTKNSI